MKATPRSSAKKKKSSERNSSSSSDMQKTLYLTKAEQQMFNKLPDALKEGWEVEEENLVYIDSQKERMRRAQLAQFQSKSGKEMQKNLIQSQSEEEAHHFLGNFEATDMNEWDVLQVFYVVGPTGISFLMNMSFEDASSDEDLLSIAMLTQVRHELLVSFTDIPLPA